MTTAAAFLAFIVNVVVVCWTFVQIGFAIERNTNPTSWILLTILFVVTAACLGQFIALQPDRGADAGSGHAAH